MPAPFPLRTVHPGTPAHVDIHLWARCLARWALSGPRHHRLASHLPSWEAALWDWSTFCRTGIKTKAPWKNDSETCSCFVFQEPQRTLPCFPLAFRTCSDVAQRLPSTSSCFLQAEKVSSESHREQSGLQLLAGTLGRRECSPSPLSWDWGSLWGWLCPLVLPPRGLPLV